MGFVPSVRAQVGEILNTWFRLAAETMAEESGISVDEAISRLKLQDSIGTLGAELERQEADTFAGLWIQHEPEYRIVVAFTRNGEETIQPYIENTPLADLVKVRTAEVTCAELEAVQQEAHRAREAAHPLLILVPAP